MSQDNDTQQDQSADTPKKTPLEMVQEQHKREQENLEAARTQASVEQHNHEVEAQRIEADEEVPGRAAPSDIRHHPQRTSY